MGHEQIVVDLLLSLHYNRALTCFMVMQLVLARHLASRLRSRGCAIIVAACRRHQILIFRPSQLCSTRPVSPWRRPPSNYIGHEGGRNQIGQFWSSHLRALKDYCCAQVTTWAVRAPQRASVFDSSYLRGSCLHCHPLEPEPIL